MKTYGAANECKAPPFLTAVLDGGVRSASRPAASPPAKSIPHTFDRRLGGSQSRSELIGKENTLAHVGTLSTVVQAIAHH
jgi:hypothetical protein